MTVSELKRALAGAQPEAEVLVRLDDDAMENPRGLVFEILGTDYSFGCGEEAKLMLDCGQPDSEERQGA